MTSVCIFRFPVYCFGYVLALCTHIHASTLALYTNTLLRYTHIHGLPSLDEDVQHKVWEKTEEKVVAKVTQK